MMTTGDEKIANMISKIDEKRAELYNPAPPKKVTTRILSLHGREHNLNTLDENQLGLLLLDITQYIAAAEYLKYSEYMDEIYVNICGFSLNEWYEDFRYLYYRKVYNRKYRELAQMEKELSDLLSRDAILERTLLEMEKKLG